MTKLYIIRISLGSALGVAAGIVIMLAQSAGPEPVAMTSVGILILGGLGALIGWISVKHRPRRCPQCGLERGLELCPGQIPVPQCPELELHWSCRGCGYAEPVYPSRDVGPAA